MTHQGRRPKDETPWSDAYCTPLWYARRLPHRNFDPCSNPRTHIISDWSFSLEKGMNGLKMPWRGSGFINWPYSFPDPWVEKAQHEMKIGNCTDLIVLCKLDPSPAWWDVIIEPTLGALDRWDHKRRIQFEEHPEAIAQRMLAREEAIVQRKGGDRTVKVPPKKISNNFASATLHHRHPDAPILDFWDTATLWRRVDDGTAAIAALERAGGQGYTASEIMARLHALPPKMVARR